MKFETQKALQEFYNTVDNADNIERDDEKNIIAFTFKKYYGSTHTQKIIKVSVKREEKRIYKYLPDKEFFALLDKNLDIVTDIKISAGKIWKYKINGKGYKTDKLEETRLFDIFPYKKFIRITWDRFYHVDELLRNGYFSGLIGQDNANIQYYLWNKEKYDLYDIDINHAYGSIYDYALPCGRFYNAVEYSKLENPFHVTIKFYYIRLKSIKNTAHVYIPLPPFDKFQSWDFLLQKQSNEMIISEYRKFLIDTIYGNDVYDIVECFYCKARKYPYIQDFQDRILKEIDEKKARGEYTKDIKTAQNSLTGMFARRDERRSIARLQKVNSHVGEVFRVEYNKPEREEKPNYLPLSMCINDICAMKLFFLLTNTPNIIPLSWNTDGAIIATNVENDVPNEIERGKVKSKIIHSPKLFSCDLVYNRPLIVDGVTNEVFNSKCIYFDNGDFIWETIENCNTPTGFYKNVSDVSIPVTEWKMTNARRVEVLTRLNANREFNKMKNSVFFRSEIKKDINILFNPYDENFSRIRKLIKIDTKPYEKFFIKFIVKPLTNE